jgi:hypothetical protein
VTEDRLEFWNPTYRLGKWSDLDTTINELVAAYGLPKVRHSLKRFDGRGRPPNSDDLELRIFVGRLAAKQFSGDGHRLPNDRIKKLWAARLADKHKRGAAFQKAERVLVDRDVLGLTFAMNELWGSLSEDRKRDILRRIAGSSEIGLNETIRRLAGILSEGDATDLEDRLLSRGMLPDEPGLPRLKSMVDAVAQELVGLAFPHGHLATQKRD